MDNQGKITVFLSLLAGSMLLLAVSAVSIIDTYMARGKIAMCERTALSGVMAEYNSYIFEHYHILLFDKTFGGKGEAYIEELVADSMEENLGDSFEVAETAISDIGMIYDDECGALKEQINDYIGYAAAEYGAEQILEATGGADGTLSDSLLSDMDNAENEAADSGGTGTDGGDAESGSTGGTEDESESTGSSAAGGISGDSDDDPRDCSGNLTGYGLISVIMPEDMELSDRILTVSDKLSIRFNGVFGEVFELNNDFDSYSDFKDDIKSHGTWKDSLINSGTVTAYAAKVFNCATEQDANDTSVLKCELEYLICGQDSDISNLKSAAGRIIAIRLPVNYSFLMTDSAKSSELSSLATSLMVVTGIPQPILKRLFAGAWAYVEAVAELRNLLAGKSLAFKKDSDNWITDLDNLSDSIYAECEEDDKGLSYKDYLLILAALDTDGVCYRMLDIMQLNAREEDEDFSMENAAVSLSVDVKVSCGSAEYGLNETAEY